MSIRNMNVCRLTCKYSCSHRILYHMPSLTPKVIFVKNKDGYLMLYSCYSLLGEQNVKIEHKFQTPKILPHFSCLTHSG